MEVTAHAQERILSRTQLSAKDIETIIEAEAFESLGFNEDAEFLLFYSPPDHDWKIAIVIGDRSILLSVWERNFNLYPSLKRINTTLKRSTYKKIIQLLSERLEFITIRATDVEFEVVVGMLTVYQKFFENLPEEQLLSEHRWKVLLPYIHEIISVVEEKLSQLTQADEKVYYRIFLAPNSHRPRMRYVISHAQLMRLANAAT